MILWFLFVGLACLVPIVILCIWITQPIFFVGKTPLPNIEVSPERLKSHVKALSEDFHPRNESNLVNLKRTSEYIKAEFTKAGAQITEQEYKADGWQYRNVCAAFGPKTKERIVIGAHYDSAYNTHGADDNASGVAGLIELAYLFSKSDLPVAVELVAYTLEEPPYFATTQMGSYIHAKSLKDQNIDVRLMISLEMIGYFSDEPGSQKFPVSFLSLFYPTRGNYIAIIGNFTNGLTARSFKSGMSQSTDLPVYSANVPTFINGVDFSDHRNYWNFGYNALMITDTAFYRNPNYHDEKDTYDLLDYNRMAKVVVATYNAVLEAAKD